MSVRHGIVSWCHFVIVCRENALWECNLYFYVVIVRREGASWDCVMVSFVMVRRDSGS